MQDRRSPVNNCPCPVYVICKQNDKGTKEIKSKYHIKARQGKLKQYELNGFEPGSSPPHSRCVANKLLPQFDSKLNSFPTVTRLEGICSSVSLGFAYRGYACSNKRTVGGSPRIREACRDLNGGFRALQV